MQKVLIAVVVVVGLLMIAAHAQDSQPRLEPDQAAVATPPVVSYTQSFPEGTPPFFNISIESSGRAEYKSTPKPKNEGDPYILKFTTSEPTRTRVFELARQLKYFHGNFDYTKNKVAFTGTKTLAYKDADREESTSYNWSENQLVQELTSLFQSTEETIELGHQLEEKYRFDKLGVDAVLKALEQEAKDNRLAEVQAIQPILTRVAKDTTLMNISRRRAEFLLAKIPKTAAPSASGGQQ
jgi:hypothetical protein